MDLYPYFFNGVPVADVTAVAVKSHKFDIVYGREPELLPRAAFNSAVAMVGIMTGVFNSLLAGTGYIAPITAGSIPEAATTLAANGWTAQVALESLKPAADGVLTVAMQQPAGVNWVISFAFVGLEVFTGIILVMILKFLNVEKNIANEQAEIKARHEKAEA